jgi:hypothetical protein
MKPSGKGTEGGRERNTCQAKSTGFHRHVGGVLRPLQHKHRFTDRLQRDLVAMWSVFNGVGRAYQREELQCMAL